MLSFLFSKGQIEDEEKEMDPNLDLITINAQEIEYIVHSPPPDGERRLGPEGYRMYPPGATGAGATGAGPGATGAGATVAGATVAGATGANATGGGATGGATGAATVAATVATNANDVGGTASEVDEIATTTDDDNDNEDEDEDKDPMRREFNRNRYGDFEEFHRLYSAKNPIRGDNKFKFNDYFKKTEWADLDPKMTRHLYVLRWTEDIWNKDNKPDTFNQTWDSLSSLEQLAARYLHISESKWNGNRTIARRPETLQQRVDSRARGTFELTAKQMQQLQFTSGFAPHNELYDYAPTHIHGLLSMTMQSRGYESEDNDENTRKEMHCSILVDSLTVNEKRKFSQCFRDFCDDLDKNRDTAVFTDNKDEAYEAVYGHCKNKKLVKTSAKILAAKQKEKQLFEEYEKEGKAKKHGVHTRFIYDSDSDTSVRERRQYKTGGCCDDLKTRTLKNSDQGREINWSPILINSNSRSSNSERTTNSDSESLDDFCSDSRSSNNESIADNNEANSNLGIDLFIPNIEETLEGLHEAGGLTG